MPFRYKLSCLSIPLHTCCEEGGNFRVLQLLLGGCGSRIRRCRYKPSRTVSAMMRASLLHAGAALLLLLHLRSSDAFAPVFLTARASAAAAAVVMQDAAVNAGRPQTWSNRLGVTLTPVATGVWAAERPFIWNNIDVGSRGTIARMGDGSLLVHSPVEWDEALGSCIEALGGGVGHIIAPSYEHLKYTQQWHLQYPDATMYGCPGLPARMPEVQFSYELPETSASFSESVDLAWMDCEVTPVIGKPFFNECVFYHKKSKSFLCADAFWNYPASARPNYDREGDDTGRVVACPKMPTPATTDGRLPSVDVPMGSAAWKFGMDVIYAPFYQRFMVGSEGERRAKYRKAVEKILSWEVEQIVPCHGDIIRGADLCHRVLSKHFNS